MVVPPIDHGNSAPDTGVVGSLERDRAIQHSLPIYFCTQDSPTRS